MDDLLAPPPVTPPVADPQPPAPTPSTPPVTPPPATPPAFNPDLPANWFLAGGDAFAAEAPTLERFKNVLDLSKSYLHLRTHGPAYPEENAATEDIDRFRALAKVPTTADGYASALPEKLPEGITLSPEKFKAFTDVAHKHHVPAPAFRALVEAQIASEAAEVQAAAQAQAAHFAATQAELHKHLGPTPEKFAVAAANVNHIVALLAEKANIDPNDPGLAAIRSNAAAIRILHQVANMTAEDPTRAPAGYGDLRSSQQQAQDIMEGRDATWSSKYKQGDKAAIDKVVHLLKQK